MTPDDVGLLVEVSDPRVSPDGTQIAYVVMTVDIEANEYRTRIWMASVDGATAPRPFTAGTKRDKTPRWSPDGSMLAFVTHREDAGSQLYAAPVLGGGEAVPLATSKEEIDDLAWSPDGSVIAFGARRRDEDRYGKDKPEDQPPRRIRNLFYRLDNVGWTIDRPRKLWTVAADGSARAEPLTDGDWGDSGLAWSPDGKWIAFASARHESWDLDRAVDLWRVPSAGGKPEQLTETGFGFGRPSWSPDGADIAFVGSESGVPPANGQVGVLEIATGDVTLLTTKLDRHCQPGREVVWDGDWLWFTAENEGNQPLYKVSADPPSPAEAQPQLVVGGERVITAFDVANGVVAFASADPASQTELYVLDGTGPRRLTNHGQRLTETRQIVAPQAFTARSSHRTKVPAWVMPPVNAKPGKRYPALLNIHGGPFTQYANKVFDEFQVYAGAGYAVIYCNPRGSSGYGERWGRWLRGPKAKVEPGRGWGTVDFADVMAVVDEACAQFDFIDPERLGVLGGSYGGYMTTWIVGHDDRFKAACSERAANNLVALEGVSDIATVFRKYYGVSHLEDPAEIARQSASSYVSNITTPMLLMHSEDDLRCPVGQAEELFAGLRLLNRDVELVRFPGEGHEMSRSGAPRHRIQRFEILLEFFGNYLQ